jgi:hypothetical protein
MDSITNYQNQIGFLTLRVIWLKTIALFMFKIQSKRFHNSSTYVYNAMVPMDGQLLLRSRDHPDKLIPNFCRTNFGKFSFQNASIYVWNFLSNDLKNKKTIYSFKKDLKTVNWTDFHIP